MKKNVKIVMFFSRHKIFIRFLLHLVLFLIFSDFCFENSITNCNPGDDDRKPAALTISEMQADTINLCLDGFFLQIIKILVHYI